SWTGPGRARIRPDAFWTGQDPSRSARDGPGYLWTHSGPERIRPDMSRTDQDTSGRVLDGPAYARTRSGTGRNSSGRDLDGHGYVWTRWTDLGRVLETLDEARTCLGHAGRIETEDEFRMLLGHQGHLRRNCTTMNAGHRGRDGDRVPDGCDVVGSSPRSFRHFDGRHRLPLRPPMTPPSSPETPKARSDAKTRPHSVAIDAVLT
ncbi:UPF0753 protein, partial [Frankliniella fusca]